MATVAAYPETFPIPVACQQCGEMIADEPAYRVPRVGLCHRRCAQPAWTAVRAPEIAQAAVRREDAMARTGIRPGVRVRRKAHKNGLVGVVREVGAERATVAWPSARLGGDGWQCSTLKLAALVVAGDAR